MNQNTENRRINGMSVIEVMAVVFLIAMLLAILLPALARNRESGHHRPSCQNNLKQWALVFKMYGNESKGELWPPMQTVNVNTNGVAFAVGPAVSSLYPEYLTDPAIAICPTDPEETVNDLKDNQNNYILHLHPGKIDSSYVYLGWAFDKMGPQEKPLDTKGITPLSSLSHFTQAANMFGAKLPVKACVPTQIGAAFDTLFNPENTATFIATMEKKNPLPIAEMFNKDIPGVNYPDGDTIPYGNGPSNTIFRLSEGVERYMITDIHNPGATSKAQSKLWIMMDKIDFSKDSGTPTYNHIPGGSNVLYLDGHVGFQRYVASTSQLAGCPDEKDADQPISPSIAAILTILTELK